MALPDARRTQKQSNGVWYVRLTLGRAKGAPVLGTYKAATLAECDRAIEADQDNLRERYNALVKGAPALDTVSGLFDAWERSSEFKAKAESTQRERARLLQRIKETALGKARTAALKATNATGIITKWRDTLVEKHGARTADACKDVLSAALSWHVRQGNLTRNAAIGIPDVYASDRSDLIWEPAHIEAYLAHIKAEIDRVWREEPALVLDQKADGKLYPKRRADGSPRLNTRRIAMIRKLANARDALLLALDTGMRRADLAKLAWIHLEEAGVIKYTPSKSRSRAKSSGKKARLVVLPVLSRAALVIARRQETRGADDVFVVGKYTAHSFGTLVSDVAKTVGIDRHLHDAKGTFVTRLKTETDLTDQEIAQLVDWSIQNVQSIVHSYVSGAAVAEALRQRFKKRMRAEPA